MGRMLYHRASAAEMYSTKTISQSLSNEARNEAKGTDVPLLPQMNALPYQFVTDLLTCSSVCSSAMFMYPSKHERTPRTK